MVSDVLRDNNSFLLVENTILGHLDPGDGGIMAC
jgi:hypothetical protein